MEKLATIIGTRPEIIKISPLVGKLDKKFEHCFIFTDQHYSPEMTKVFFEKMKIRKPDKHLHVYSSDFESLTEKIKEVLKDIKPEVQLIYGDTVSTVAACAKLPETTLIHIEAGLRSLDYRMDEEVYRKRADKLSDYRLAPTNIAKENLLYEGYPEDTIAVVGNLVVDAYKLHKADIEKTELPFDVKGDYIVLTLHRQENVDYKEKFSTIIDYIASTDRYVIYPIHPRAKKHSEEHGIKWPKNIQVVPALDYLVFMKLLENANLVMTDSGGVQEEAITVGIPCITLRRSTERPETILLKANICYNFEESDRNLSDVIKEMEGKKDYVKNIKNPYGKGDASDKIMKFLERWC